jgi:hypothetical protein
MANERGRNRVGPLNLRIESGRLITPNEVASKIENMYLTTDGTLRSIDGPLPYVPEYPANNKPGYTPGPAIPAPVYEDMHGVYHCLLEGGKRDVLLVHTGSSILVHKGWDLNNPYEVLLGPASVNPELVAPIATDSRPQFPTQFEVTPTGVVIVPQDTRAYFYDGYIVAPLGYSSSETPGAPLALGPSTDRAIVADPPNNAGYSHRGGIQGTVPTIAAKASEMRVEYGNCRIGFTRKSDIISSQGTSDAVTSRNKNILGGVLDRGSWAAAVQFVDFWGNLSPLSPASADVTFDSMENIDGENPTYKYLESVPVEAMRFQVAWAGINRGPERTVARKLVRTKDKSRNPPTFYDVPSNCGGGLFNFATIPDNSAELYPDNTPDTWLLTETTLVDPVPEFKLCRLAFGRLWIANFLDAPGQLRFSLPNRFGTFPQGEVIVPDTNSAEITGLWSVGKGLLVFTERSTFLIVENDSGDGFRGSTLHPTIGCVAPSSIQSLPGGQTIWLGQKGFYSYEETSKGISITPISIEIKPTIKRINPARRIQSTAAVDPIMGEYRCWVPHDGSSKNNLCLIYDGSGWRQRTDVEASSVCTTKDHRNYQIVAGNATNNLGTSVPGVWVLDRSSVVYPIQAREGIIETAWLKSLRSSQRSSLLTAYFWIRATRRADLTVEAMRDWRTVPVIETTTLLANPPKLYAEDDVPPFWNETLLGETDQWEKRRPFWVKVDFHMPSCEVFKLRLKYEGDWEFLGLTFEDRDVHGGGVQVPP